jgi:hypothetical protein
MESVHKVLNEFNKPWEQKYSTALTFIEEKVTIPHVESFLWEWITTHSLKR